jgi:hypothetical protein
MPRHWVPYLPTKFPSWLIYHRFITKVLAFYNSLSPPCFTVTSTSLPDDCTVIPHCAQPQVVELRTHTIPCGYPAILPTIVVPIQCPRKCTPLGHTSWTSILAGCEETSSEAPGHFATGTITVDVPLQAIISKVKCVTITKTDGVSCTMTAAPACPTQNSCTSLSTVRVTNYCGCNGIKETTICKTTCKYSSFPMAVPFISLVRASASLLE